jgi:signal transduction histidine kinase
MHSLRWRFLGPLVLISLSLVTLCALTAASLFRQQQALTLVLRENIGSRRAAAELEECLIDLIALLKDHVEAVSALNARLRGHLTAIDTYADQPEEEALAERLADSFARYRREWRALPPPGQPGHEEAVNAALRVLEGEMLPASQELRAYNSARIEESTGHHDRVLRQLAWGMAGIGGLGGVAGVVLGFAVARGVSQSIRRLQVQIRDAAGKLSPGVPEIVLTGVGDFRGLQEQIDQLTARIETVVQELQQREREVLRAEQLAAVGQLAAGVAHEIRNPLTSIKLLVQAGQEDGQAGGLSADDLAVIEHEVRRVERSLQTFLDFARPPKPNRRPAGLGPVLDAVFGLIRGRAAKQRVGLQLTGPADAITLTADTDQLQQVFVNLALNALDAMPAGGTLTFAVRKLPGKVEVEVADTGAGIPAELMPRLFEPFVSGKDTGLGLGLVISRRIVEDHDGTLTAANRPGGGGGACLTVCLPPAPPPGAPGRG